MYLKKKGGKEEANIDLEINEFLLIKRYVSLHCNDYINEKKINLSNLNASTPLY